MKVSFVIVPLLLTLFTSKLHAQAKDRDYYLTQKNMIDLYAVSKSSETKKDSSHNYLKAYNLGNDIVKITSDEASPAGKADSACKTRTLLNIYYENKVAFLIRVLKKCELDESRSLGEVESYFAIDNNAKLTPVRKAEYNKYFLKASQLLKSIK